MKFFGYFIFPIPILCFLNLPTDDKKCPNEWDLVPHNNHCYLLVDRPMPQNLAQKYCSLLSKHAHLARVRSQEQNDFLQEYAYSTDRIWLSSKARFDIIDSRASLNSPGLVLRWDNGVPVSFSNWMKGQGFEHISMKQLCVVMDRHGKWLNSNCDQLNSFVCELKSSSDNSENSFVSSKCPKNWSFNSKTSACYKVFTEDNMTWLDADRLCSEEGAKHSEETALASVHSHTENQFLLDISRKEWSNFEYIMLGAIGHSTNANQWDWIDGTSFSTFSNWQQNKPSGAQNSAVLFMRSNGKWINWYADKRFERKGIALAICKFLVG